MDISTRDIETLLIKIAQIEGRDAPSDVKQQILDLINSDDWEDRNKVETIIRTVNLPEDLVKYIIDNASDEWQYEIILHQKKLSVNMIRYLFDKYPNLRRGLISRQENITFELYIYMITREHINSYILNELTKSDMQYTDEQYIKLFEILKEKGKELTVKYIVRHRIGTLSDTIIKYLFDNFHETGKTIIISEYHYREYSFDLLKYMFERSDEEDKHKIALRSDARDNREFREYLEQNASEDFNTFMMMENMPESFNENELENICLKLFNAYKNADNKTDGDGIKTRATKALYTAINRGQFNESQFVKFYPLFKKLENDGLFGEFIAEQGNHAPEDLAIKIIEENEPGENIRYTIIRNRQDASQEFLKHIYEIGNDAEKEWIAQHGEIQEPLLKYIVQNEKIVNNGDIKNNSIIRKVIINTSTKSSPEFWYDIYKEVNEDNKENIISWKELTPEISLEIFKSTDTYRLRSLIIENEKFDVNTVNQILSIVNAENAEDVPKYKRWFIFSESDVPEEWLEDYVKAAEGGYDKNSAIRKILRRNNLSYEFLKKMYKMTSSREIKNEIIQKFPVVEQIKKTSKPPKGLDKNPEMFVHKDNYLLVRKLEKFMQRNNLKSLTPKDFKNPEISNLAQKPTIVELFKNNPGKPITLEMVSKFMPRSEEFLAHFGTYDGDVQSDEKFISMPRYTFSLNFKDLDVSPLAKRFIKEVSPYLRHIGGEGHQIGTGMFALGWILFKDITELVGKPAYVIEQLQSDWRGFVPKLRAIKEGNEKGAAIVAARLLEGMEREFPKDELDKVQSEINNLVKNYPEKLLSAFLQKTKGKTVYMTNKETIMPLIGHTPEAEEKRKQKAESEGKSYMSMTTQLYDALPRQFGFQENAPELPGYFKIEQASYKTIVRLAAKWLVKR